ECLRKRWTARIYGLYGPEVTADIVNGSTCHIFKCLKCRHLIQRNLLTTDQGLTGNLLKHAKVCWGKDIVKQIGGASDISEAHKAVKGFMKTGKLTVYF
ncbi:hypothetical protein C8Q80DRAFT_1063812, partial [Daedaleopsis nitida]